MRVVQLFQAVIVAITLIAFASPASAQVTEVGSEVSCANSAFGGAATCSVNATGANYCRVWAFTNDTSSTAMQPTAVFNTSESLTRLTPASEDTNQRKISYFYIVSPSQTTANLVVTWADTNPGANRYYAVVQCYSGVDTGTPHGTPAHSAQASGVSITSGNVTTATAAGIFTAGMVTRESGAVDDIQPAAGTSNRAGPTSGTGIQWVVGKAAGSTSNVTMGWSWTGSEANSISVVPLNAAATTRPCTLSLMGVGCER